MDKNAIYNSHLEGDTFFLSGERSTGILLIHGFTATTAEVRPLANFLNKSGYTISAPLLPGHLVSPEALNRTRYQDWIACAERSMKELLLHNDKVIVGGESTGGLLSLYLASSYPNEVCALLLYAPALSLNLRPSELFLLYLLSPFVPYIPKPNWVDNPYWQGYRVYPLRGAIQLIRLQNFVRPRLNRIHQPILVVQGRHDRSVHPGVPQAISKRVSSNVIEIHWMEKSSHCVIIDQEMEQVFALTIDFLEKTQETHS